MNEQITLAHGSGGSMMHELIKAVFKKHLSNNILDRGDDAAELIMSGKRLAFTTDSFVVSPIFFKGGNIGKLAVCGTVNDLCTSGAKPLYLSCGFILEEGFPVKQLEEIVASMAQTAAECGVKIVTGDTKVVPKGAADKIFINTSGIGEIPEHINISGSNAKPGDSVIISGPVGDHGCTILLERENLGINTSLQSDCAPLYSMAESLLQAVPDVHVLRDPTRGGLATTLNEISQQSKTGICLVESQIPVRDELRGVCELLGMDPLYMACEGRLIVIVPKASEQAALTALRGSKYGSGACVIGEVTSEYPGKTYMKTLAGGSRILDMLVGDQLPRIC